MTPLNIFYVSSGYQSLRRVADQYRTIIGGHHNLANRLLPNAIVFLHCFPQDTARILNTFTQLRRHYVIAYLVWETNKLPDVLKYAIRQCSEIWTCSEYCCSIFRRYHPLVFKVPHVITRDLTFLSDDLEWLRGQLGYRSSMTYYLAITDLSDTRKNAKFLVEVFKGLASLIPSARLIIKTCTGSESGVHLDGNVIYFDQYLSTAKLNALYHLSTFYVSPHHSEGWGLTMSDATLFEKPVIATGYSGNLEFMSDKSALLLPYNEEQIRLEDESYLFDRSMRWAYPTRLGLENRIIWSYANQASHALAKITQLGLIEALRFDERSVSQVLLQRLSQIG